MKPKYLPYTFHPKLGAMKGGYQLQALISELRRVDGNDRYHCYKLPKISVVSRLEKRREKSPVQNTS